MACSRKVREAARRYWLLGYSDEKIVPRLAQDFPDEKTPARPNTILTWRKQDGWEADLEIIAVKAAEKRSEMLSDEIAQMNAAQLELLTQFEAHLQLLLARIVKDECGEAIDSGLTPLELSQMTQVLDKTIKNQRLIRDQPTSQQKIESHLDIDFSQLTDEQLERIASGEHPATVLGDLRPGSTRTPTPE